MPCSRTYIADTYLDALTGQLAEHRDLTEVSDTADLCKGLTDDLDVPMVSEVHRQLVGEGSHRRLVYSVKFGNCKDAMLKFFDDYDANLVIIEKLPSGVFADPFELQHFVERKVFLDVGVFGDTNLELPSALSNRSAVEIHFDLKPSKSRDCNLVVELPLHARYPPLDTSGYATVEFRSPDLLVRYRKKEAHPGSCIWVVQNLDAAPLEKAVWRVPCGDEAHAGFVSSVTFVSALVCSMSIVLAASLIS
ncbi:phosphatidylinositol-glycan biosynthesis class X protein-like isoform X2 [Lolium rigidum]|nr:phosphatidylinositol-glycan biosynthesis class X protein-like isoform X2 [Lolium rigidum]XP_047048609.1 phosphatidylinositol-glycan biosynthesis class X protein-like isoform X2 [Lolium rigidum]